MNTIQPNKRVLAIAVNLLYRICGDATHLQLVDYDWFHILVSLNDECETKFGVIVVEEDSWNKAEYQEYVNMLGKRTYQRNDADNYPIMLLVVNSSQESAQIGIQLGWSSAFTPIVYSPVSLTNFDEQCYSKLYLLIKAMNSIITVLSREYLSVLKKISIHGIAENGYKFEGSLLYARAMYPSIPSLVPEVKKYLDRMGSDYEYSLQFNNDELDNAIFECTKKNFANIAIVSSVESDLLFTNKDVQALQLYGKMGMYNKKRIQYYLLPCVDVYSDNNMFSKYITPIRLHKMTLVIRGQYDTNLLCTLNQRTFDWSIEVDKWVEYSNNINTKLETLLDLYDFIV